MRLLVSRPRLQLSLPGIDSRACQPSLPRLSLPWAELLMRHFEWTHARWATQQPGPQASRLAALHEAQRGACLRLRQQCFQLLAEPQPVA